MAHTAEQAQRLIIREGTITLVVDDTQAARKSIEALVAESAADGAFVVSSGEQGNGEGYAPSISMVIRVPAARFDATMERLAGLAVEVRARDETAQDVTEDYVDAQARLASMEAARDRLRQIMAEAKTTQDLLQAEQQLTQREADIEALQGRIKFLQGSAALSKITITLLPHILTQPVDNSWRLPEVARGAFDALVATARFLASAVIYLGIAVLPWLLLLAAVVWGARRLLRRRQPAAPRTGAGATPAA